MGLGNFWYLGVLLFAVSFTFSRIPKRRHLSLGYQCRFQLGSFIRSLSLWNICEVFPPFDLGGGWIFLLSVLRFALSFTFLGVSGSRLLLLVSWFRSPLEEFSWWLLLIKFCKRSPHMGVESFWSSGILVSALSFPFPGIPDRGPTYLGYMSRFSLVGFKSL